MKKTEKLSILISIVLISLLAISAVSAAETDDNGDTSINDDLIGDTPSNDIQSIDNQDNTVKEDEPQTAQEPKSFTNLKEDIEEKITSGENEINFTNDYIFNESDTPGYIEITSSTPFTINGNGYTIDAKEKTGVFKVNANLIIKNLNIINAKSSSNGGAIYIESGNLNVTDSNFINNTVNNANGGAIYVNNGASLTAINVNFINNTASRTTGQGQGGAIYNNGVANITKSKFTNNTAYRGGAIYGNSNTNANITKSTFINDRANNNNGAEVYGNGYQTIVVHMDDNIVINSATNNGIAGRVTATNTHTTYTHITMDILNKEAGEIAILINLIDNKTSAIIPGMNITISIFQGTIPVETITFNTTNLIYTNTELDNDTYIITIRFNTYDIYVGSFTEGTIDVTNKTKEMETKLAQKDAEIAEKQAELDQAEADLQAKQAELDQAEADLQAKQAELDQAEADLATANTALIKAETERDDANKALATKNAEAANLETQVGSLKEKNNQLTSDLKTANNKADDANANLKKVKAASKVKKSKNFKITATLNKKVKGKYVYVVFNGKSYKAKTDKNGVAKITIKKSALKKLGGKKVKYQVMSGQKLINKSVKVKK